METHRPGNPRKNRCISATDSEWRAISDMAHAAGMPISRFVLQKVLTPAISASNAERRSLPEAAEWDQLRDVMTLMRIAEENMERRGDADRLASIRAEVEQRISARRLGF